VAENEVPLADDPQHSPQEFLNRMDTGEFDGNLSSELKKLSEQELSEVAKALSDRDQERSNR